MYINVGYASTLSRIIVSMLTHSEHKVRMYLRTIWWSEVNFYVQNVEITLMRMYEMCLYCNLSSCVF